MLDLKKFKETIVSYGMRSPFVKQMPNSWFTQNRIIPQDWKDLATAVLEAGPQLHREPGGEMKLWPLSNMVGLEVVRFPKIKSSVRTITLMWTDYI